MISKRTGCSSETKSSDDGINTRARGENEKEKVEIVRVLVDVGSRLVTFTDASLNDIIWKMSSLIDSKDPIFVLRGMLLNPRMTFGFYNIKNGDRINVLSLDPNYPVVVKSENSWTNLEQVSNEERNQTVYGDYLKKEESRIKDLRYSRIKRFSITDNFEEDYTNPSIETIIPTRSTKPNDEPLFINFAE